MMLRIYAVATLILVSLGTTAQETEVKLAQNSADKLLNSFSKTPNFNHFHI